MTKISATYRKAGPVKVVSASSSTITASSVSTTSVGSGTLDFSDPNNSQYLALLAF
jgi:hypothetical protein